MPKVVVRLRRVNSKYRAIGFDPINQRCLRRVMYFNKVAGFFIF